jgi:hypothetical protein
MQVAADAGQVSMQGSAASNVLAMLLLLPLSTVILLQGVTAVTSI